MEQSATSLSFFYETIKTGKVHFSDVALNEANTLTPEKKFILAGICRNRTIRGEPVQMITSAFLHQLNNQEIPYSFDQRGMHFLNYLYNNGGKEYKHFNLNSANDSTITFSSKDEFERIIRSLEAEKFIHSEHITTDDCVFYQGLTLTKEGIHEIEKGLPKMPLFGLVEQEIKTGDMAIDSQIEYARHRGFLRVAASSNPALVRTGRLRRPAAQLSR